MDDLSIEINRPSPSTSIIVLLCCRDISTLARAAVSGDETALDMFNWKKGKNNMRLASSLIGPQEATTFFLGGANGK